MRPVESRRDRRVVVHASLVLAGCRDALRAPRHLAGRPTTFASGPWGARAKSSRNSSRTSSASIPACTFACSRSRGRPRTRSCSRHSSAKRRRTLRMLGNTWVPEFVALDALEPLDAQVAAFQVTGARRLLPGHLEHERRRRYDVRYSVVRRHARDVLPDRPAACRWVRQHAHDVGRVARGDGTHQGAHGRATVPDPSPDERVATASHPRVSRRARRCFVTTATTARSRIRAFARRSTSTSGCSTTDSRRK